MNDDLKTAVENRRKEAIEKYGSTEKDGAEEISEKLLWQCFRANEIGASEIYTEFKEWWSDNISKKVPSQKKFGRWMNKKFKKEKIGTYRYYGLGLLSQEIGGR